ncbi:TetR/AcrR family transcriptional regulator [Sphingomonas sp. GM_Shp_1]|uniref:TetR/AcrR family transcriptional regulator n=1 Tax=Sphingomonas sp. GM_Shp_1 TaxID=2937381 RepID=UPI00226B74D1|nr:TetR/AcrR family transcriptional regulator [Sphingomonas sp. GM_Shp_1]
MDIETIMAKARAPQQGRSKASFERMLATAEELMTQRGSDEFTLNEVAKHGKVSIGSIYCRFDSKDDLVHVVQLRVLERVDADMLAAIAELNARGGDLIDMVHDLVESVAEVLRRYADLMRPLMLRASADPVIAAIGKRSYARTSEAVIAALLTNRDSIPHADPEHAADAGFRILYAAIARYLGFGSSIDAAGEGDWSELKTDLADMLAAYLSTNPKARAPRA